MENDKQELEKIKEIAKEVNNIYENTKEKVAYLQGLADGFKAGMDFRA